MSLAYRRWRKRAETASLTLLVKFLRVSKWFDIFNGQIPIIHRNRFYASLHHGAVSSKPALALVYAMLAFSAPYHLDPSIRATARFYYERSRECVEIASSSLVNGQSLTTVSVEMVQACVVLLVIEMGNGDHQVGTEWVCLVHSSHGD